MTIAPYNKFYLGVRQNITKSVSGYFNGNGTGVTPALNAEWASALDPVANPSAVIDLNGLATSSTATYGIMDGSLSLGAVQRLTTITQTKHKHGEDFTDYHFTNRLIKFNLRVNGNPTVGVPSITTNTFDVINAAVQRIQRYINLAYQWHVEQTNKQTLNSFVGQPIELMLQIAQSSQPVYFDIIGGFINSDKMFDSVSIANGYVELEVELIAKYSARGDYVWLSNAVINGDFYQDGYNVSQGYWGLSGNAFTDTRNTVNYPPIIASNAPTAFANSQSIAGTTTTTLYSAPVTISTSEYVLLDMYYALTPGGMATNVTATLQFYRDLNSSSFGWVDSSIHLTTAVSTDVTPNANGQYQGARLSSVAPASMYAELAGGSYNSHRFALEFVTIRLKLVTTLAYASATQYLFINHLAIWRYPGFVPTNLMTLPVSEYINVIPDIQTDQSTTISGVRGDIESEAKLMLEVPFTLTSTGGSGESAYLGVNALQTASIGMRQLKGAPIPRYHKFHGGTAQAVQIGPAVAAWTNFASRYSYDSTKFVTDGMPRSYKLFLVGDSTDVSGLAIKLQNIPAVGSSTYALALKQILPSSLYPYLPSTSPNTQVLLDLGVMTLPSSGFAKSNTNYTLSNAAGGGGTALYIYAEWLTGLSGGSNTNVNMYEFHLLPSEQYFYCDTRHIPYGVSSNLQDGGSGWSAGLPLFIDGLSGVNQIYIASIGIGLEVCDTSPQYTLAPLALYPASSTWFQAQAGGVVPNLNTTGPMEVICLPRLPDSTQTDYIKKNYNGDANTATVISVGYYPRYVDFNSQGN